LQDLRLAHARVPVERVATIKIEIDELEVRNEALQQEVKVKRRYVFSLSLS
jgi:FtsZ-binding cell division protein ZapB